MKKLLLALLVSVLALFTSTAIGLGFIHVSGQPYRGDMHRLNISETSGFSEEKIIENYNAVMDYLSPFSNKPFDLPSMRYSASGAGHFEDCKPIFNSIYLFGFLSAVALGLLIWRRKLTPGILRSSGVFTLIIPALLFVGAHLNFDRLFVLFHKLFFNNSDWLFDPAKDEIIKILPEAFFMHCAFYVGAVWVLAAALQLIFSSGKRKE